MAFSFKQVSICLVKTPRSSRTLSAFGDLGLTAPKFTWAAARLPRMVKKFNRFEKARLAASSCLLPASLYWIIALLVSGELRLPVFTPRLRHPACLPACKVRELLSFAVRLGE